jgi:ATP-binding cassette subfamily B protein
VLEGGKIIACGNHEELMKTSDVYRETYEAQTKGKASENNEGGEA